MKGDVTMINMNEVITGITLSKACSFKADADSTESKTVTLRIKFDGATLKGVFDKAVAGTVIQWVNGVGRKKYDTFKPNQIVDVTFTSPASTQIDPMEALIASAKAAGVDVTDEKAIATYIMAEMKKRV